MCIEIHFAISVFSKLEELATCTFYLGFYSILEILFHMEKLANDMIILFTNLESPHGKIFLKLNENQVYSNIVNA